MSEASFLKQMIMLSMKKAGRDKMLTVIEFLELIIPLVLFFSLATAGILEHEIVIKLALLLLMVTAMGTAAHMGAEIVVMRRHGFMQEIYSSPLHTWVKLAGLITEPLMISLTRGVIAIALLAILGYSIFIPEIAAIIGVVIAIVLFTGFAAIILASFIRSHTTIRILIWIVALCQFAFAGLMIPQAEIAGIAVNPYSYMADMLLHAMKAAPNYSLGIDLAVTAVLLMISFLAAIKTVENAEI